MMKKEEILLEIRRAIAEHELRVAIYSGVLGLLLLAGTWHSIWLLRGQI